MTLNDSFVSQGDEIPPISPDLPVPGDEALLWMRPEDRDVGEEGMPRMSEIIVAPLTETAQVPIGARVSFEQLHQIVARTFSVADQDLISDACHFATEICEDGKRLSQMLEMGIILAEMHIDATGIVVGIIHRLAIDPDQFTVIPAMLDRMSLRFGPESVYLIESIARFTAIEQRKGKRVSAQPRASDLGGGDRAARERDARDKRVQLEKVRKMFVAMGDDPRIVIFKLAEHLQRMRERGVDADTMEKRAQDARDIYAPLAGRLGMSRIEAELEDRAFAVLDPAEYRRVQNLVTQAHTEQKVYIDRVCSVLRAEADQLGINVEVSGRFKHLWSIYRKLVRNGWDITQIYDLIAFRIVVPSLTDCYTMLGQVHALWIPKEDRIKDFIAHRKPNGYQSLHTTVFCLDNRMAEIQIRTREMHQSAEYGVAIHWYYKDAGDQAQLDKKLARWLQQLRDWQSDLQQRTGQEESDIPGDRPAAMTQQQIFVFTPHGDVKDLPAGSTPIDFAYRIHTSLGDRCVGAKVTSTGSHMTPRMVPLDYVLENGQIVEILTRKDAHPKRDWLTFVRTHAARTHINRYLREHDRDIYVTIGQERLDREMRLAGLGSLEALNEDILHLVMDALATEGLKFSTIEDLFAAIGGDTLRPSKVIHRLQPLVTPVQTEPDMAEVLAVTPPPGTKVVLNLVGAGGLLARLANCCHPLPGDDIVGYISRGRGIVIHHSQCRSLKRLLEREAGRKVRTNWEEMGMDRFDAAVIVVANDRTGLLRDVTQQIHEMHLNMGAISTTTSRKGIATIQLTLQINELRQLDEALHRIQALRDVQSAERDRRGFIDDPATR